MYRPKPFHSLLALLILTLSMVVACLWPFKFHPHNDVMYVPDEQALRFDGYGTAYSLDSLPSLRTLSERNELTIEIVVKPKRIFNSSVPNILSLCPKEGPPSLVIGAWKKSLVVRLGRPGNPGWGKYREIGVGDIFTPGKTVHLVISLSPKGTTIYVGGLFKRSFPDAILDTSTDPLGRLLLGTSLTGGSLWKGDIRSLALYDRARTPAEIAQGAKAAVLPKSVESDSGLIARYRFDTIQGALIPNPSGPRYDIVIPAYFSPMRRTVLELPRLDAHLTQSAIKDIVLNVLGFMPFGFLALLCLGTGTTISPRWQSTLAVLAGFSFSLGIELIQVFLPSRSSSLLDLATNTLGTAGGVLVFIILYTVKPEATDKVVASS